MPEISIERRVSDRRVCGGGGRRATDSTSRPFDPRVCPMCFSKGTASLAGESDGGWWFVCLACDYLWDQRQADRDGADGLAVSQEVLQTALRDVRAASFWRRLAFRRADG